MVVIRSMGLVVDDVVISQNYLYQVSIVGGRDLNGFVRYMGTWERLGLGEKSAFTPGSKTRVMETSDVGSWPGC